MIWDCWIPGKDNTPWASTSFKLEMVFRDDYPSEPPMIYFRPRVFHINVRNSLATMVSVIMLLLLALTPSCLYPLSS